MIDISTLEVGDWIVYICEGKYNPCQVHIIDNGWINTLSLNIQQPKNATSECYDRWKITLDAFKRTNACFDKVNVAGVTRYQFDATPILYIDFAENGDVYLVDESLKRFPVKYMDELQKIYKTNSGRDLEYK